MLDGEDITDTDDTIDAAVPAGPDPEWWDHGEILALLEGCDDDVAAFLVAAQALTPAELHALTLPLGVPDTGDLKELTVATVIAARRITGRAERELRQWAAAWRRSPRAATAEYRAALFGVGPDADDT